MIHPVSNQKVQELLAIYEKYYLYSAIAAVLEWDASVGMPPAGAETRGKSSGLISTLAHQVITSPEFEKALVNSEEESGLNETEQRIVSRTRRAVDIQKKIPDSFVEELANHAVNANVAWEQAKKNNDFTHFEKDLEHMFALMKQYAQYKGYEKHPYDALIDDYELGMTTEKLQEIFGYLVPETKNILTKIKPQHPNLAYRNGTYSYPVPDQEKLNHYLMEKLGLVQESSRLALSAHPFTSHIGKHDVRITARYDEHDFLSNMTGTIHETGHALYDLGVSDELEPTILGSLNQLGLHESQSRTWENFVGRTKEFATFILPKLQELFPALKAMTVTELYELLNHITPSMIRVEADQVTYNLHIALRFDIEVGMLDGTYTAHDLPVIWNEKMKDYFGITPKTDREGVLQDIHWSYASIGYFPTYTLGNLYAAQLMDTFEKTHPEFWNEVSTGNFTTLRAWLRENLHQYGVFYTADEILTRVTGKESDPRFLIAYLQKKYT